MQQLTGLDAAFLAMETPSVFGHVGSVCVLDPSTAPEPLTLDRLTRLIEGRLHLLPPFRRRLVPVPLGLDQPYWIEDPDFDIEYHVRELALPAPGDDRQLAEQAARLHARALDRRRPLWEIYLIHGLAGGPDRALHQGPPRGDRRRLGQRHPGRRPRPVGAGPPRRPPAPPWECDPEPSQLGMLVRSAATLGAQPLRAARLTYGLARSLPGLARTVAHAPAPGRRPAARPRPQRRRGRRRGPAGTGDAVQRPGRAAPPLVVLQPAVRRGRGR